MIQLYRSLAKCCDTEVSFSWIKVQNSDINVLLLIVTPARRFAPAGVTARRLSIRLLTALVAPLLARSNKRIDRQK